jgi:hypothetical protein
MTYRVLFRMSLNKDKSSVVRNKVDATLGAAWIRKRAGKTATWEASGLNPDALNSVAAALKILARPSAVAGANAEVAVDHVWLYFDRDMPIVAAN